LGEDKIFDLINRDTQTSLHHVLQKKKKDLFDSIAFLLLRSVLTVVLCRAHTKFECCTEQQQIHVEYGRAVTSTLATVGVRGGRVVQRV
jgi:hypothetical protein